MVLDDAVFLPGQMGNRNVVVDRTTWTVTATPDTAGRSVTPAGGLRRPVDLPHRRRRRRARRRRQHLRAHRDHRAAHLR